MATRDDGRAGGAEARRWRLDERERISPCGRKDASHWSGRRAVVALVAVVLSLWLGLDLAFRGGRPATGPLAEFGASMVAPAIDPIASSVPPDVPPGEWQLAVSETHAMLLALTGAGVLSGRRWTTSAGDIAARVALARPETARQALVDLWTTSSAGPAPSSPPTDLPPRQLPPSRPTPPTASAQTPRPRPGNP